MKRAFLLSLVLCVLLSPLYSQEIPNPNKTALPLGPSHSAEVGHFDDQFTLRKKSPHGPLLDRSYSSYSGKSQSYGKGGKDSLAFGYDGYGRLSGVEGGPSGVRFEYPRSEGGMVASLEGKKLNYFYNSDGNLYKIKDPLSTHKLSYDAQGTLRRLESTSGKGKKKTDFVADPEGRLNHVRMDDGTHYILSYDGDRFAEMKRNGVCPLPHTPPVNPRLIPKLGDSGYPAKRPYPAHLYPAPKSFLNCTPPPDKFGIL